MNRKRLSKQERKLIYDICRGKCAYCGCDIELKDMQVDHIYPIYRGGEDVLDNMLPACRSCNHYKSTLTIDEFRKHLSGLANRLYRDNVTYRIGLRYGIITTSYKNIQFYYESIKGEN